jgi:hypothetical protein
LGLESFDMTQDEIKHDLLQVCKVKGWDGDFNILGFHVLCDKLKQLGADEEREACAKACEKVAVDYYTRIGREHEPYMKATAEDCAMQIRERGQPKRKQEPTCPECKAAVLYECVTCSSNNYPPAQPEERNFCQRCGKRTADLTTIHTCTPPQENT